MAKVTENSQELANNSEQIVENSQQLAEIPAEAVDKRGRGRPKGVRDSAPRKRRIIEEPVTRPQAPTPPEPTPPQVVAPTEPVRAKTKRPKQVSVAAPAQMRVDSPEPPNPRSLLRQAGEVIYQLHSQRESARRDYWAQQVHKSLR